MSSLIEQTSKVIDYVLADEQATLATGRQLAAVCLAPCVIFLQGPLGAGKTTLVRGILHELGVIGSVKSPTFTLVEPYQLSNFSVFHFDLYRLDDPDELEYIGLRDYFTHDSICLIEWPEKGQPNLPQPDLTCALAVQSAGRSLKLYANSAVGETLLRKLSKK